jgi:hypothetical protein
MSDTYGGAPLQIAVPGATAAVADPVLDTLLSFFTAVINAYGGAAWTAIAPGTGGKVVKSAFAHNPTDHAFKIQSTPAIYLWRDTIMKARQIAADWRVRPSRLMLRWVPFPVYQQDRARRWEPFFNAIPSILDAAIEKGRDPSWVMPGDLDARAAAEGSLLWNFITVHKLEVAREDVKRTSMAIPIESEKGEAMTEVLDVPLELEERLNRDLSTYDLLGAYAGVVTVPPMTTVAAVAPTLTGLSLSTAPSGSGRIEVQVYGSGFFGNSEAYFGGTRVLSVFVSDTRLALYVPGSLLTSAGTKNVTVRTPSVVTTLESNALPFIVT